DFQAIDPRRHHENPSPASRKAFYRDNHSRQTYREKGRGKEDRLSDGSIADIDSTAEGGFWINNSVSRVCVTLTLASGVLLLFKKGLPPSRGATIMLPQPR